MKSKIFGVGGLIIGIVALLAVNIAGPKLIKTAPVDLTDGQLFTLSEGTHNILSKLEEPITLRFYLSRRQVAALPGIKSYADRVEELLEQYRRESGGKISVVKMDPEPFSDEEDRAVAYGLRGVPLDEGDNTLYFGLVGTGSTGQEEVIPFFTVNRERFLEYDVSRMIYALANPKRPVVGLLSTLNINGPTPQSMMQGISSRPWMIMEHINELFSVLPVDMDAPAIPEEVDVLMVVHPKLLSDKTLYAIDQFVMGGGRVLMFIDPLAEVDQVAGGRLGMMQAPTRTSNPSKLLESWGVSLTEGSVVGDVRNALRVQTERGGRMVTIEYPVWMSLGGEALNESDMVTANLENLTLVTPGALAKIPASTTTVTPLIRTSDQAMAIESQKVDRAPDPEALMREYKPGGEPVILAARISGPANSAFPDGRPKDEQGSEGGESGATDNEASDETPHLTASVGGINVVLVADADMLHDRFWVRVQDLMGSRIAVPTAGNGSMVINALDNLTGSSDLIAVRSRGSFVRPFDRIDDLRKQAELAFREKEAELIAQLDSTEQRLRELEREKQGSDSVVFNEAQREELIKFRKERLRIRKELRDVRRSLRRNIESLQSKLRFANIALVPLLIAVGGLIVAFVRMQRRRSSIRLASS